MIYKNDFRTRQAVDLASEQTFMKSAKMVDTYHSFVHFLILSSKHLAVPN